MTETRLREAFRLYKKKEFEESKIILLGIEDERAYKLLRRINQIYGSLNHIELSAEEREFILVQLTQAMDAFQTQFRLFVQLLTVLITANVILLGYGIGAKSAGIFMIGAVFPLAMIIIIHMVGSRMKPIILGGIMLEARYRMQSIGLISTFLNMILTPSYVIKLEAIAGITDLNQRRYWLRRLPSPLSRRAKRYFVWFALISVVEIIMGALLSSVFGWNIF